MQLSQKQIEYYRLARAKRDLECEKILDEKQAVSISAAMDSKCAGKSKGIKSTGNKWLPCDDSGDVYSHDVLIAIGDGVSVKEINLLIKQIGERIKDKPDAETLEFWNNAHGDNVAFRKLDDLKKILAEIEGN